MKLPRRTFLHLATGAVALPAVSCVAWAQAYPMRPVLVFVGYASAGILLLILLNYALRGIGTVVRRK